MEHSTIKVSLQEVHHVGSAVMSRLQGRGGQWRQLPTAPPFKSLIHCKFITNSDSPRALRDFFILTDLNAIHSGMEAILEKKAVGKWRACSFGARLREGRGEIIPRQCVTHICGARRGFAAKRDLEFTRNEPSTASLR